MPPSDAEATHGTLEFDRARAEITARLVEEAGFTAVAVEDDWPDAWRVNRVVRGHGPHPETASGAAASRRAPRDLALGLLTSTAQG